MAFTGSAVEIMALIILVVAAIKIVIILINPNIWMNSVTKKILSKPKIMMWISLVLAVVALYLLIGAGITIVEIFAVMLFFGLLVAVGMSVYSTEILAMAENLMKDKTVIKKSWLYIVIWIVLIVWGLYALFV